MGDRSRKRAPIRGRDASTRRFVFEDPSGLWKATATRHTLGWDVHVELVLAGQLQPVKLRLAPVEHVEAIAEQLRRIGESAQKLGTVLALVVLKGPNLG